MEHGFKFMSCRVVAESAIWSRLVTTAIALAFTSFSMAAHPEEEKPNKIERTAKKVGHAVEKTARRAGNWTARTATRAGKWVERTANKTDKAIRRAVE
jgi:hypothetical protein